MNERDAEDVELAERLEAYAEARLSPSLSASSRMRAHVMAAAQRQAALARAEAGAAADHAAAELRPRLVRMPHWRRPVAGLLAASLTLALAVGSVAAAQPGGPLYGTRVWAETLTLPSSAADRAAAEVGRLNERLAEAAAAVAAGDVNAADAALTAYNGILAEAAAGTKGDSTANATLNNAIQHNIDVLTAILQRATFPNQARDAIQHAIDQTDSTANGLKDQPGVGGPPSNPGNGPAATTKPGKTANPNKPTPGPVNATQKPAHPTPQPHVTREPAVTPAPEHTPRASGRPSNQPDSGGQGG